MGTFVGHLVPGLALALFGIWHAVNTIRAYYLNGCTKFVTRFWHPFNNRVFKLKHLELILVLAFSLFSILMQIVDFPYMHVSFKLDNFEHATMFLHLAIFASFSLFAELTSSSEVHWGFSGILAASVFGQELFLLHYHSADHVGLEGYYHWLLQLIVCVSFLSAFAGACFPTSFPVALILTISVIFQGCWLMNMGFMLWDPDFVPRGCVLQLDDPSSKTVHGAVMCSTQESAFRARALANLQFSWILSAIMIFVACTCLSLGRDRPASRRQSVEYAQLHNRGTVTDIPLVITGLKETCM